MAAIKKEIKWSINAILIKKEIGMIVGTGASKTIMNPSVIAKCRIKPLKKLVLSSHWTGDTRGVMAKVG